MVKPPKDVTAAELAILEQLWKHQSAAVKDLSQWLYGSSTPSDIATVQKLLARLEGKNFVMEKRFAPAGQLEHLVTLGYRIIGIVYVCSRAMDGKPGLLQPVVPSRAKYP